MAQGPTFRDVVSISQFYGQLSADAKEIVSKLSKTGSGGFYSYQAANPDIQKQIKTYLLEVNSRMDSPGAAILLRAIDLHEKGLRSDLVIR